MSKKQKFDLSHIVHDGLLKEGEKIFFVSDPKVFGIVSKHPSGEFKIKYNGELITVHMLAQKALGMDPPDHASKWFRAENGKMLFDIWQADIEIREAA